MIKRRFSSGSGDFQSPPNTWCRWLTIGITTFLLGHSSAQEVPATDHTNELLVVVGAEGEAEYGQVFLDTLTLWHAAAIKAQAKLTVVDAAESNALERVETFFKETPKKAAIPLWIVLIGHGTYDRREAFFNLAGPDLPAKQLQEWIEPIKRPLIIMNTASCSGAFLPILSAPNRIIVTATKSGNEVNYASFGTYLANALLEPEADLNNDGENSVYECYYYAAQQTADFYEQEGRIATETPLLDDNGDGRGTSLENFEALRDGGTSKREPDGAFAKRWALILSPAEQAIPPEIRQKRNVLESQIDLLRRERDTLGDEAYYNELEKLALQIAELYESMEEEEETTEEPVIETGEDPAVEEDAGDEE